MIVVSLVAGLYLSISAQAMSKGFEIQAKNQDKVVIAQDIADLRNQLGDLTADPAMLERAKALGYDYANPSDIEYILVPGYSGRQTASLAPQTATEEFSEPTINPEYTSSLSEILFQGLLKFSAMQARRIP